MLRTRVNQAAGHEVDFDVKRANEDQVALGAKNSKEYGRTRPPRINYGLITGDPYRPATPPTG